ncbi:MAG: hypothetical protein U0166_11125 [Acidobacteriota bacterium]
MPSLARGGLRDILVAFVPIQAAFLWFNYLPGPRALLPDEARIWNAAYELAIGGNHAPTFLEPPGEAYVAAVLVRAFGPTLLPLQFLQIALLIAGGFALRALAGAVGLSRQAADLCLMSYLCNPELVAASHYVLPDVAHLFFAICAALCIARGRSALTVVAGLSLGAAVLLRSLLIPLVPLFALAAAWPRAGRGWSIRPALLLLGGVGGIAVPAMAASEIAWSHGSLGAGAAFHVWIGLNDRGDHGLVDEIEDSERDRYLASSTDPGERERVYRRKVWEKVREDGAVATLRRQVPRQLRRLVRKESFFTDQLPGGATPTYSNAMTAWATFAFRAGSYFTYAVLLATGITGMFVPAPAAIRKRMRPFLVFVFFGLATAMVFHVSSRDRLPLLPVLFLYVGIAYDRLAGALPEQPFETGRTLALLSVLATALWLAI